MALYQKTWCTCKKVTRISKHVQNDNPFQTFPDHHCLVRTSCIMDYHRLSKSLWRDYIDACAIQNAVICFIFLYHDKRTPQLLIYKLFTIPTNHKPVKQVPSNKNPHFNSRSYKYILWTCFNVTFRLHFGHWDRTLSASVMQRVQNMWPHTVEEASFIRSRQTGQHIAGSSAAFSTRTGAGFGGQSNRCSSRWLLFCDQTSHWWVRVWFSAFDPMPGAPCAIAWPFLPANPNPHSDTLRAAITISESQIDHMARTQWSCFWFAETSDFICTHLSKTKINEQNQPQKKRRPFFACCHFQVCWLTCQLLSTNGIDEILKIAVQYPLCVMHCDAISFASALTSSSSRNDIADY